MDRRATTAFAGASVLLDRGMRDQLRLAWRLMRDDRVPALKFALPALLALYLMSPVDLIPDFFLGLGQMDDLGVVVAGVVLIAKVIPRLAPGHLVDEHVRDMSVGRPVVTPDAKTEEVVDARFNVRG
jgi:uncharacterized membrane protein YkvA (DUF1232 family)